MSVLWTKATGPSYSKMSTPVSSSTPISHFSTFLPGPSVIISLGTEGGCPRRRGGHLTSSLGAVHARSPTTLSSHITWAIPRLPFRAVFVRFLPQCRWHSNITLRPAHRDPRVLPLRDLPTCGRRTCDCALLSARRRPSTRVVAMAVLCLLRKHRTKAYPIRFTGGA